MEENEKKRNREINKDISREKIAVIGIGGVGGYLAGMLSRSLPHITVVARNSRKGSIQKKGLVLHSDRNGEIISHPDKIVGSSTELDPQDIIFICVKNYSLDEVCMDLSGAVTGDTVIVPVMNGVGTAERIRRILKKGIVIDALIYIIAFANEDYSISQQTDLAHIKLGSVNGTQAEEQAAIKVSRLLRHVDIDASFTQDIECEIWKKYILNCAYNVITSYYDSTVGPIRADPQKASEYDAIVEEAYQVALAKGIKIPLEYKEAVIRRFYQELPDSATSSMQRDFHAGRRLEIETFSGYLIREAHKNGIAVPVSEKMYRHLTQIR